MTKTRITSTAKAIKSDIQIIFKHAIKRHAGHQKLIDEIERITREIQTQIQCGEVVDIHTALLQYRSKIENIGAVNPLPPKPSTPKIAYGKGPAKPYCVANQASKAPRLKRELGQKKAQHLKKIVVKK
jgi:hypothetical protein